MKSKKFQKVIAETPEDVRDEVRFSMDVLERLHELLHKKFDGKQKLLAEKLAKSESEVSKWFNGYQNFTTKTLLMLSRAFGEPIIVVCSGDDNNTTFVQARVSGNVKFKTLHIESNGGIQETTTEYAPVRRTESRSQSLSEEIS
jgi:transcriptional regulator with XRE-family HTH domain